MYINSSCLLKNTNRNILKYILFLSSHTVYGVLMARTLEWFAIPSSSGARFVRLTEIKSVNPKGNQLWIFIKRTDAEAPIFCPPDMKSWLTDKDSDAGKNWGQEEMGTTEDEMLGWHHWLSGHESEQTLGGSEGQSSLACCSPWGCKELDMT